MVEILLKYLLRSSVELLCTGSFIIRTMGFIEGGLLKSESGWVCSRIRLIHRALSWGRSWDSFSVNKQEYLG